MHGLNQCSNHKITKLLIFQYEDRGKGGKLASSRVVILSLSYKSSVYNVQFMYGSHEITITHKWFGQIYCTFLLDIS